MQNYGKYVESLLSIYDLLIAILAHYSKHISFLIFFFLITTCIVYHVNDFDPPLGIAIRLSINSVLFIYQLFSFFPL